MHPHPGDVAGLLAPCYRDPSGFISSHPLLHELAYFSWPNLFGTLQLKEKNSNMDALLISAPMRGCTSEASWGSNRLSCSFEWATSCRKHNSGTFLADAGRLHVAGTMQGIRNEIQEEKRGNEQGILQRLFTSEYRFAKRVPHRKGPPKQRK